MDERFLVAAKFLREDDGKVHVDLLDKDGNSVTTKYAKTEGAFFFPTPSLEVCEFRGYITHVDGQQSFYVQRSSDTALIDEMQAGVAEEAGSSRPLSAVRVGQACISQYSADGAWNRAQVLSIVDGKTSIRFIDYGNEETTNNSVLQISNTLAQVPPLAWHCCLDSNVPSKDLFAWAGEGEWTGCCCHHF